jgi:hypothetical protein
MEAAVEKVTRYIETIYMDGHLELEGGKAEVVRQLRGEAKFFTDVADIVADPDIELVDIDFNDDGPMLVLETTDAAKAEKYQFDEMVVEGEEDEDPILTPWAEARQRAYLAKVEQEKVEIATRLAAAGIEPTEWAVGIARDLRPEAPEVKQAREALNEATKTAGALAQKITQVMHPERPVPTVATTVEEAYRNLVAVHGEESAKQIRAALETTLKGQPDKIIEYLGKAAAA